MSKVAAYINKEDGLVCAKCYKPFEAVNNKPVAWMSPDGKVSNTEGKLFYIPLYTHPVKEQNDYCKAYWGNDNKFVDVFLPNSETEVIRFWNNTHPVKDLEDIEINITWNETSMRDFGLEELMFAKAILRKAQEK